MYGRLGMFEPGLLEIAFSEKAPRDAIDAFLEEYKHERVVKQSSAASEPSLSNYYLHVASGKEAEIMALIRNESKGIVADVSRVPMRGQRYGIEDLMKP